jgi:3-methylfumaryl-CoA hydratase
MWGGGRIEFRRALRVGDAIERTSTIVSVEQKEGRSGALVFVLVSHEISANGAVAIVEEHDIVYRDAPRAGEAPPPKKPAPADATWRREVVPDDVLLFRYSALTFNSHRIHYDRRYVTEVEGYPGLVVHGPLIATLLVDLARDHVAPAELATFSFRAMSPLFDIAPFAVCGHLDSNGNGMRVWAQDAAGHLAMEATATIR